MAYFEAYSQVTETATLPYNSQQLYVRMNIEISVSIKARDLKLGIHILLNETQL